MARQIVNHGHVRVNGRRVDIPSYLVRRGDIVSVRERSRKVTRIQEALVDMLGYASAEELVHLGTTAAIYHDPALRSLAIELTRITFPYLLMMTLVTLYGGMLNVMHRFASAAAASIFLNLAMMMTLALAGSFPTAGAMPTSIRVCRASR